MTNATVFAKELVDALEVAGFRLEAINPEVKKGGRWKPRIREGYFSLATGGDVYKSPWDGDDIDNNRYAISNVYKTEAEAIAARDKQLALVRVQDKLEELTDEPLVWGGLDQFKGAIAYNHNKGIFVINDWLYVEVLGGLYGSKSACNWVINNMESDLKLIAGVE